jgi:hypothetical protein
VCVAGRAASESSKGRKAVPLLIILEVISLVAGLGALLTIVGLGPVVLLLPDCGGSELLLAPFVGLATLYLSSQWLSPHFASGPVIVATCVVFGALSVVVAATRPRALLARASAARIDIAIVVGLGFLISLAVMLPVLHAGTLTLADFSGDDLFTWAPTATYMQTHAYAAPHATAYVSPLLWLLPTNIYPGSAGTVDGGLLAVFGLQATQLIDVLTAVCLAAGAGAVYLLLRLSFGTSRIIAGLGLLLVATNQSRFLMSGFGLAQAARGTALMLAAILLFLLAFTQRHAGLAALAGAVTAVLAGVYMPAFLITCAAVVGGAVVVVFAPLLRRGPSDVPWKIAGVFSAAGLVAGIPNLRWLFFGGGVHAWVLQTDYGRDLWYTVTYPLQYLTGAAPVQFLWRTSHVPPFAGVKTPLWSDTLSDLALVVAALLLLLIVIGIASLVAERRWLPTACVVFPLLYGGFVFVDNRGGFGSVVTVFYLVPLACVLAAVGVERAALHWRTARTVRHARSRHVSGWVVALSCGVGLVLLFQVGASAEDEAFFVQQPGVLSPTNLQLSHIAAVIPKGASVLMYASDGSNGDATVKKTEALVGAAGFLPDRDVTIDGRYFQGTYTPSDRRAITSALSLQYQYILHAVDPSIREPEIPPSYRVVWKFPRDGLVLLEREDR